MIHKIFFSFGETIVAGWTLIGLDTLNDSSVPLPTGQSRSVLTGRILSPIGILVDNYSYGFLNNFISSFSTLGVSGECLRPCRLGGTYHRNSPEAKLHH